MGLFDFARNIGKKLFHSEEEAPVALENHINEDNPGIDNVQVKVQDGVATISGDAKSPEALEKAVLMVGNAMGVETVKADDVTVQGAPVEQVAADEEFYIIQKGDTLWKIAENTYGNGSKYKAIVEANREVIKNENLIFPGQKIRIPSNL